MSTRRNSEKINLTLNNYKFSKNCIDKTEKKDYS